MKFPPSEHLIGAFVCARALRLPSKLPSLCQQRSVASNLACKAWRWRVPDMKREKSFEGSETLRAHPYGLPTPIRYRDITRTRAEV